MKLSLLHEAQATPAQAQAAQAQAAQVQAPQAQAPQAKAPQAKAPQAKGMMGKMMGVITTWLQTNMTKALTPTIMQLASEGDATLIAYLNDPTKIQGLTEAMSNRIIMWAIDQAKDQLADLFPGGKIAMMVAGKGINALVNKMAETPIYQYVQTFVGKFLAKSLRPGNIPDELSANSPLLKSFDLPDNVSEQMDPEQQQKIMQILAVLRNKPDLFAIQWDLLQRTSKISGSKKKGAATKARAGMRGAAKGKAV